VSGLGRDRRARHLARCRALRRAALAARLAQELGTDLRLATAYADSAHDLPLLEAVGVPVAVAPDRRLLRAARENGWEVLAGGGRNVAPRRTRTAERGYM